MHGKCSKLNDEECIILCKSGINLVYFCTTCSPNLDEALELFDDNKSNSNKQNSSLPEKHTQLENKLAVVETTLHEIKKELTSQLSKCREMLSSPNNIASKPPALIANTVYTAINEEKEREKRQLNLIIHNLAQSNLDQGEARKAEDIKHTLDIFNNYLGAKATVSRAIRLGKRSAKPRLLKVTVDSVEAKAFILRSCTNLRKADPASYYHKIYVTPDLTPAQREANLQLHTKLKEMIKDGKSYVIKNGRLVQRRN